MTVPLVDIRAGVYAYEAEYPDTPIIPAARQFLEDMRKVYYMERTIAKCSDAWNGAFGVCYPCLPQKSTDAIEALENYSHYHAAPAQKPTPEDLSMFFRAWLGLGINPQKNHTGYASLGEFWILTPGCGLA